MTPGDTVEGRYRIVKPLDEGGMGTVFLAEHVLIKRRVAIKFLRPELATDPDVIERFMNEARAAGTLGHPNIVESTDMGFTRGDVPYIVFEYLEGSLLVDEIYRSGGLRVPRAIRIAYQIASALHAAHNAGIVHRDLKSENIFLTHREEVSDHVKVLDFGISRFAEAEADAARAAQRNSTVMGTPEFMAPEQITAPETVDRRADIYALGVILYEMLTARRPFKNEGDLEAMLRRVVSDDPPALDVAGAPPGLSEMIRDKLLAKNPDQRYQTMKDVQSALEAFHTVARPTGSITPLSIVIPTPPPDVGLSPARVVELAEPRRTRLGPFLLGGALLAAAAGVAMLFAGGGKPVAAPDTGAKAALRADATQLAQTIEDVARATRMRADAMAATPLLRAAIETDAATIRDMALSEHLFTPAKGDVIEVFQDRHGKGTLLLRLPDAASSSPEMPAGQAHVARTGSGLEVLVASQVTNQAGAPSGTLEIATTLDLSATGRSIAGVARDASIVGLGAPVSFAPAGAAGPGEPEHVAIPITLTAGLASAPLSLEATITRPPPVKPPDRFRAARLASWGIAALLALIYAGTLLRTRRQR